jgi:hypothetical protein
VCASFCSEYGRASLLAPLAGRAFPPNTFRHFNSLQRFLQIQLADSFLSYNLLLPYFLLNHDFIRNVSHQRISLRHLQRASGRARPSATQIWD